MGSVTKQSGDEGERRAGAFLVSRGCRVLQHNYRVSGGPGRPGGEVDLIVRDRDGTLVFVEVRRRRSVAHGGAAASVTPAKQRRLVHAATTYLQAFATPPPCRFDVVVIDGDDLVWLPAAFDAS